MAKKRTVRDPFPARDPADQVEMVKQIDARLAKLLAEEPPADPYLAAWRVGSIAYCQEMLRHLVGETDCK